MARVKRAVHGKKHRRAILEQAQGYYGNKSRSFRAANEQVMHSGNYAFRDRRARKGDFRQLWMGDSVSQLGVQLVGLAMPIMAVRLLGADEFQMGLLATFEFLAFLVIGLPAGAWVDRWRKQRVLIAADVVRALIAATCGSRFAFCASAACSNPPIARV